MKKRIGMRFAILDIFVVEKAPLVIVSIENNTFNVMHRHIFPSHRAMIVLPEVMGLGAILIANRGGLLGGTLNLVKLIRLPKQRMTL